MAEKMYLLTDQDLKSYSKSTIFEALDEYEKRKASGKVYYVNQVAKIMHKSPHTIKKLCEQGFLKTTSSGLITQEAIDEYLNIN